MTTGYGSRFQWIYKARPVRVVDGDTIVVVIDHGMNIHSTQSLRVAGIDTPELFSGNNREAGAAARDFTENWIAQHCPADEEWPLIITTIKDRRSFNRYVAVVTDKTCQHDLALDLMEAGHDNPRSSGDE